MRLKQLLFSEEAKAAAFSEESPRLSLMQIRSHSFAHLPQAPRILSIISHELIHLSIANPKSMGRTKLLFNSAKLWWNPIQKRQQRQHSGLQCHRRNQQRAETNRDKRQRASRSETPGACGDQWARSIFPKTNRPVHRATGKFGSISRERHRADWISLSF